ncbi:sulfotransferase family protein [Roseicitreum antarcticum]|uniref:Sulfotransferase family protein n=1 Tax=Roseicitreum antarcticum TaxID=564137 RepID=A0A1H2RP33_9RHOB|nr:sulfotransferase family protein [Roseicitreum antarcticum]SDW21216.1 Sulfotransferase family protein [Roseicitreum antarcticum]
MRDLTGVWLTESQSLLYQVVPKAACSTIGQILHASDHGRFFDGDIHDATTGLIKWPNRWDSAPDPHAPGIINANIAAHASYSFSAVRNPFTRIVSCFFDKICTTQRDGLPYGGPLREMLRQNYGVQTTGDFDQIASFRRFLLFARDTLAFGKPQAADIHWLPQTHHLRPLIRAGGRYDAVFQIEDFGAGMAGVLAQVRTPHAVALDAVPRFNPATPRQHPVAAFFDDLAVHLTYQMYRWDFVALGYAPDPAQFAPVRPVDLTDLHLRLGDDYTPHWT